MNGVLHELRARLDDCGMILYLGETEWKLLQSYADDALLLTNLEEDFNRMVGWFDDVCWRRVLKANPNKHRTLVFERERKFRL